MSKNEMFKSSSDVSKELAKELAKANEGESTIYEEALKQGSKAWFRARLGNFTGSKFPNLMTGGTGKKEWGKTSFNVIRQVFIERDLSDVGLELYVDELYGKSFRQTEWGNRYESYAVEAYRSRTGFDVEETEFRMHPTLANIGGSFDGEIIPKSEKKIIEVKCPYDIIKHQDNLDLYDGIPEKHTYYGQIQGNIEIAGADSCDFISYDPRRKDPETQLFVITVERDQHYIDKLLYRILVAETAIYFMSAGVDVEGAILLSIKELTKE